MKQLFTTVVLLASILFIKAQNNVGIGTNTPSSSAMLDIASNTKGLLIPRMNSITRNAIANPAKGLIVYDSTTNGFWYYNSGWRGIMGNTSNADSSFYNGGFTPVSYNMTLTNQTVIDQSGYLYDSGGPSGAYSNNENKTFSISMNGYEILRLIILSNNLESPYDSLIIRANGYSFGYTGTQTDTLYLLDGITGQVDIQFKSNGANPAPGFAIRWDRMVDGNAPPVSDPPPAAGWYFIPDKKTMLGGTNLFHSWNRDSVGNYSFSYGRGAVVKGDYSVAFGSDVRSKSGAFVWGSSSSGNGAFVAGDNSNATSGGSILGDNCSATGYSNFAIGTGLTVGNFYSGAIGYISSATGSSSFAFGNSSYAIGDQSMALGFASKTLGGGSITLGNLAEARGSATTTFGYGTVATGSNSTAMGEYNDSLVTALSSKSGTTPLLMVGNGNANNQRSNAFLVLRNGRVHIDPKSTNSGNLDSTALMFGAYNSTGEGISSKRNAGGNQYGLDFYTSGFNRLAIGNNGNIGIGITTPSSLLHIKGTGSGTQLMLEESVSNTVLKFSNDNGVSGPYAGTTSNHNFSLVSNNAVRAIITNTGTIDVKNNLTVQNGKGIIRNVDGTQSKKLSAAVVVNTTLTAGQTLTFPITWPEAFSSVPECFVGNVTSGAGGWAEAVMTISGSSTTGATLYVYNPKASSVAPNFTIRIIAIGPQ